MFEFLTTPIVESSLSPMGCRLFYKRDDLLPFSFRGNKARIAAEFYEDLKAKDCDTIIGYGSVKSNLSRAVSSLSTRLNGGGDVITSYEKLEDEEEAESFNASLARLCGVRTVKCLKSNVASTVQSVMDTIRDSGGKPYYIYGDCHGNGNEIVPMNAYIKVSEEIARQEQEMGLHFGYVFLATGTAMTQSGLIVGSQRCGLEAEIIGISVARPKAKVEEIIKSNCSIALGYSVDSGLLHVSDKYLCGGYGESTMEVMETIKTVWKADGVALDSCYTGKAFYGMISYLREQGIEDKNVLFIHTGGLPLFFDDLAEGRIK